MSMRMRITGIHCYQNHWHCLQMLRHSQPPLRLSSLQGSRVATSLIRRYNNPRGRQTIAHNVQEQELQIMQTDRHCTKIALFADRQLRMRSMAPGGWGLAIPWSRCLGAPREFVLSWLAGSCQRSQQLPSVPSDSERAPRSISIARKDTVLALCRQPFLSILPIFGFCCDDLRSRRPQCETLS